MKKLMDNCIARVPRNANEEIKIHWGMYWATEVIDIRWYQGDKPTKGVRFNKEEAEHIFNAMKIIMESEENGIISRSEKDNEENE
tara:strand:+ start:3948 stop:4202 length:255 start_codon:yes stop_codon:yes gene_type:complete